MAEQLNNFFSPRGVALIGTSANPDKLSFGILRNLVEGDYQGEIYPVNPKYTSVLGKLCYPEINMVPDPVDHAVVALSAPSVPAALEECGKRGILAVTIISGGFREIGKEGLALERQCIAIAHTYGMRVVGPNCVGTMDLYTGLNTTFIKGIPIKGGIGFLSQSGAICGAVVDYVLDKDIGFSKFVSLGNMADVNETDMIEYLSTDDQTHVIALYLEGLENGHRFMDIAGKVAKIKPIVVLKVGQTNAGARAVSSHTGSLAGSHKAYQTAFNQTGIIPVNSASELFDVCIALSHQKPPRSNRTAIITNSGGPAALASDSLEINKLQLVDLAPATEKFLRDHLVPSAQIANPVDMLGGAGPEEYRNAMNACLQDPNIDSVVAIHTPQALVNPVDIANAICDAYERTPKTTVACFMGGNTVNESRHVMHQRGIPMYVFPESTGSALGSLYQYGQFLQEKPEKDTQPVQISADQSLKIESFLSSSEFLGEYHTRTLLEAYGIPVIPGKIARTHAEARAICNQIGFPVALKIASNDILHKSDSGGILLNLNSMEEVENGFKQITAKIKNTHPNAVIDGLLVEKMAAKGHEIIIGMQRDPTFGPLIMFGLGGIFVELLTDVSFRIAPISLSQAKIMIMETKAGKLLSGLRGGKPADMDAVISTIQKIALISLDFPVIEEIEINPLVVYENGNGVMALDSRCITKHV